MDIDSSQASRHSEEEFSHKLSCFVDAGVGIMQVRTNEIFRAITAITKQAIVDDAAIRVWDAVHGFTEYDKDSVGNVLKPAEGSSGADILEGLGTPLEQLRDPSIDKNKLQYFVYVNPQDFIENVPALIHYVLLYGHVLPSSNVVVILLTPDIPLPGLPDANILSLYFEPPSIGELRETLSDIVDNVSSSFDEGLELSEDEANKICYVGAGMPLSSFEMYASLSIVKTAREGKQVDAEAITEGVALGKTEIVKSNDILELYPSAAMSSVGGLENLKEWVAKRRRCYSDEAKEFGIAPPKGVVLVGVPGTGKSLVAKAIASELGVPLVRLDFGRVFNSLVGESESRMRKALHMVESMSPCVLFCDEIDKGLGGIGGSGDSGTSNRVLGAFLTWLQENKHPVFVMVTANNVDGLPPEMLRKGRFDAIFSTTLPTEKERREVLAIHLRQRKRDIEDFEEEAVDEVVRLSKGYVPAEIEAAVAEALVDAFAEGEELTMQHVADAISRMVPLSVSFADKMAAMAKWAQHNATPAGKPEIQGGKAPENNKRIRTTVRRRDA